MTPVASPPVRARATSLVEGPGSYVVIIAGMLAGCVEVGTHGRYWVSNWPCAFSELLCQVMRVNQAEVDDRLSLLSLADAEGSITVREVDALREGMRVWLVPGYDASWFDHHEHAAPMIDQLSANEPPVIVEFSLASPYCLEHTAWRLYRLLETLTLANTFHGSSLATMSAALRPQ